MNSLEARPTIETLNGAVIVDKPAGWTSHDVVNRVRRLAGTRKVGHLGTLDPNATGVLPLLIGRVTRLARFFERADKAYEGVVRFGCSTDTWDAQGRATSQPVDVELDPAAVNDALSGFLGRLSQMPPPVSAKKINGVPAYKLVRQNQPVNLSPCDVEVYSIELSHCHGSEAGLRIQCSAGTYVRSIAHELGQMLGCGAHLESLRRTRSGDFLLDDAVSLDYLTGLSEAGRFEEAMLPTSELLREFPAEIVDETGEQFIRQGRDFRVSPFRITSEPRFVKAVGQNGSLVAIGEIRLPGLYHPVLVL